MTARTGGIGYFAPLPCNTPAEQCLQRRDSVKKGARIQLSPSVRTITRILWVKGSDRVMLRHEHLDCYENIFCELREVFLQDSEMLSLNVTWLVIPGFFRGQKLH
jgi:hypothetical protein